MNSSHIFLVGLFSCFEDVPTCVLGCCVPCWLYGQVAEQIDGSEKVKSCVFFALAQACGVACLLHQPKRQTLRGAYNLEEKPNDWFTTCCCGCCALIQEAQEMKLRGLI